MSNLHSLKIRFQPLSQFLLIANENDYVVHQYGRLVPLTIFPEAEVALFETH